MHNPILELCKLGAVPSVSGSHEVARNALQAVDMCATAVRTYFQIRGGILKSTIHASVAVVVDRAIAYIIFVHEVYYIRNCFRIVGGIAIDLDIEYVSATCHFVVRPLDFSFMLW